MQDNILLSIIIVNYNTADLLLDCVSSVFADYNKSDAELIIVDNASVDNNLSGLKKAYPQVSIIENQENLGFSRAVNQALSLAKGRFTLLLNPDTVISNNCFAQMLAFLERTPDAAACGPAIYGPDKKLQMSCYHFPNLLDMIFDKTHLNRIFRKNRLFGRYQMSYWAHDQIKAVDWITGACFMLRTESIRKINGLDPRFFMFCEDIDLCLRLKQAGWKVYYLPHTGILHYKSGSSDIINNKPPLIAWESLIIFWQKHHSSVSVVCLKIILGLDAALKIVILSLLSIPRAAEKDRETKDNISREIYYFRQILKILG